MPEQAKNRSEPRTMRVEIANVTEAQALAIEDMLAAWVQLGAQGSSRWTAFFADGDGNFRPQIRRTDHARPGESITKTRRDGVRRKSFGRVVLPRRPEGESIVRAEAELIQGLTALEADRWHLGDDPIEPWRASLLGREMVAGTDGHVLVGVDPPLAPSVTRNGYESIRKAADKWKRGEPLFSADTTTGILKTFAGVVPEVPTCSVCSNTRKVTCDLCDGEGVDEECQCMDCGHVHEAECSKCDGAGEKDCDECSPEPTRRPATIAGHVFDRNLIVKAFGVLGVDNVRCRLTLENISPNSLVLLVEHESWIVVAMSMRDTATDVAWEAPDTWAQAHPAVAAAHE